MSTTPPPDIQYAASFDGSAIAFRDWGGPGPVLVMIPGWACIQTMWDEAAHVLRTRCRVVSLDLAGFGSSTAGRREWTIEDFARDVMAVIDGIACRDVTLVGHSMGGAVALEAARLCGNRVRSVIGADSFTYPAFYKRLDRALIRQTMAPYGTDYASTVRGMIGAYLLEGGDADFATLIADVMAAARPEHAIPAMEQFLHWDVDESLARCPVPVSSINSRPFLSIEAAESYKDRIDVHTIDGVGHFLMMEKPDEFARICFDIVGALVHG